MQSDRLKLSGIMPDTLCPVGEACLAPSIFFSELLCIGPKTEFWGGNAPFETEKHVQDWA